MTKNKNIKKFLRHPLPKFDESISGYLIKLAEANGYCYRDIWSLFGLTVRGVKTNRPLAYIYGCADYSILSCRTKLSDEQLKSLAYQPVNINPEQFTGIYKMFNNNVEKYMFRYNNSALCSKCLSDNSYQRKIWDFLPITACPVHKRMLLERCPQCEKTISYRRNRVCFCDCGYDFRIAESEIVPDKELVLASHIYHLCGLLPAGKNDSANIPPVLSDLDLIGLLHSIFLVSGQIAADGGIRGRFLSRIDIKERHQILSLAAKVYDDFPKKFFEFLKVVKNGTEHETKILNRSGLKNRRGNTYNRIVQLITKSMVDPQFHFLQKVLDEFLKREKLSFHRIEVDYTKTTAEEFFDNHITLHETAQLLKTSILTVLEMVKNNTLNAYGIKNGEKREYYINLESIEQLKGRLNKVLSVGDAARLVNIRPHQINSLIDTGVLNLVEDVKISPLNSRIVEHKQIGNLYKLFYEAMLKNPAHKSLGRKLSSKKTAMTLGLLQIKFGDMTQMIINGELAPAGCDESEGLNRFTYDEDQIKNIVELKIKQQTNNTLLVKDLSKLIRVKKSIVQALFRKGYLDTVEQKNVLGKCISKKQFMRFQKDYILSTEIACKFSTSAEYANKKLADINILPVDTTIDRNNYLYRRSDVKNLIIGKFDSKLWCYAKRYSSLLSIEDAAKLLGLSESDLLLAVKRKLIYFSRGKYRKDDLFSIAGINSFQKLNLPHINFLREREAAEMLMVNIKSFRKKFLNTGLIVPEVRSYRHYSRCCFYLIEDIYKLKEEQENR